MAKSILRMIIGRVIGFLIFLVLLAVANFFTQYVHISIYSEIVYFFNSTIILLLSMAFLGLVNELFWHFYFPFNVLAPITGASLGVLITNFIYKFWNFVNGYIKINVDIPIELIYIILFWIIVIAGYIIILFRGGRPKYVHDEKWKEEKLKMKDDSDRNKRVEWEDVDDQFRLVLYNIGKSINNKFSSKNNNQVKKKKK